MKTSKSDALNLITVIIVITIVIIIVYILIKYMQSKSNKCPPKIIPPLDEQITIDMIINKPMPVQSLNNQKIPKIIMQTNELSHVPIEMFNSTVTILEDNTDYAYYYYDNNTARKFLEEHFDVSIINTYDKLIPGAYKADLFRYCFLYEMGGVYIDTGMISKMSLSNIINHDDEFIAPEDNNQNRIYNAFMASIPKHPIIKIAIDMVVENVKNKYYGNTSLDITGPGLLYQAFVKFLNIDAKTKLKANKDYNNHIRIIKFVKTNECAGSGDIDSEGKVFLHTKYPTYYIDRMWYNSSEHYSRLWEQRNIYN